LICFRILVEVFKLRKAKVAFGIRVAEFEETLNLISGKLYAIVSEHLMHFSDIDFPGIVIINFCEDISNLLILFHLLPSLEVFDLGSSLVPFFQPVDRVHSAQPGIIRLSTFGNALSSEAFDTLQILIKVDLLIPFLGCGLTTSHNFKFKLTDKFYFFI
jgi:hypothetical protein